MSETHPITTVASTIAWKCPYYRIRCDEIRLKDGKKTVYNVVETPDSVFVVPVLEDGRIVLIRSYRHTLGEWVWEVPAGGIKTGQSAEEAARQELKEEIGGTADKIKFLMKASTMNGIGHHLAHFFLATGVTLGETQHESLEFMVVHPMTVNDVFALIQRGEMNDAVSITALFLAKSYLDDVQTPIDPE